MSSVIEIDLCGNQCLSAEDQIRLGYKRLFQAVQPLREQLCLDTPGQGPLSHFVSMKGTKYDEQEVKLLLIGRAVNGWALFDAPDANAFAQKSIDKLTSGRGFDWLVYEEECGLHNTEAETYFLNRSAFWRAARRIHADLSNAKDPRWVEYIAWSNLYKIAPLEHGNPCEKMCKAQQSACIDILKGEIEFYRPTHILFLTGWNWFDGFKGPFTNVQKCEGRFVEGAGTYQGARVIVSVHPQGKPETEIVNEVLCQFKRM